MSAMTLENPVEDFMPMTVEFPESFKMDDAAFEDFCRRNPDLRIEQDREGNVIVMAPVGNESGHRELGLGAQLYHWAEADGTGLAFSSSTLFTLPDGSKRSPDASWMRLAKWESLDPDDRRGFTRVCPDFALELRSFSDRLAPLEAKMRGYMENGVALGILIDPVEGRAHLYRPGGPVETLERPDSLSAEPEMPGLVFDLRKIWQLGNS